MSFLKNMIPSGSAELGFAKGEQHCEFHTDDNRVPSSSRMASFGGLWTQNCFKNDSDVSPLVTIITVVYNGIAHLDEAIASVLTQSYENIEYIVVDGGSSDGSLELIEKYEQRIDYWISESDSGIYDAMNKGLELATGRIIGFLNSDDILADHCIQQVVESFQDNPSAEYTVGAVDLIDENGALYGQSSPLLKWQREERRFLEMPCPHLSMFVLRSTYERLGFFDTSFKLSADYDFVLRLMADNVGVVDLPFTVGCFRSGGKSGGMATWLETRAVLKKNGASLWQTEYAFIRSVLRSSISRLLPVMVIRLLKRFTVSKNKYY